MPKNAGFIFAPGDYAISTAALGVALPTQLPTSSLNLNLPAGWYDVGLASDAGVTESHNVNETSIYDLAGNLQRIIRNQESRPWTFECLQDDAIVSGLMYPTSSVSTTGATAEVQTITLTGSPTAGTFTIGLAGFPTVTAIPFNVTASALQTQLQQAWDIPVTVTLASNTYTLTFPASEGNVAQTTTTTNFTPNTAGATTATTTPGVTGINSRGIGSGTGRNLRQFCIDLFDGTNVQRNLLTYAEAVWSGSKTYSGSAAEIAQFTVNPYKDPATQMYYTKLDNLPGMGLSYA